MDHVPSGLGTSSIDVEDGCKCCRTDGRNIVVCIDGTSSQFGERHTNIMRLYDHLIKDDNQIVFYHSGIGTYTRPSEKSMSWYLQVLGRSIDLAIAWSFENIIIAAYEWLSENYRQGDRIFLFGFSCGAYQVRCLSAMINAVGLIHRGNNAQIPFAFELYADIAKSLRAKEKAERFRATFGRVVSVHFVGAWDTVSSVGISRTKTLPETTSGMKHACYFRHALALDEKRVNFLPQCAYEGDKRFDYDSLCDSITEAKEKVSQGRPPHIKEVWFAGTHLDVGGSCESSAQVDCSKPPLRWMSYEATAAGIRLLPSKNEWKEQGTIAITESLTWSWWPFEALVWTRMVVQSKDRPPHHGSYSPHLGRGRHVRPGQMIHVSALHHILNSEYEPEASLKYIGDGSLSWHDFANAEIHDSPLVERDLYETALAVVDGLFNMSSITSTTSIVRLIATSRSLASSYEGSRALREVPNLALLPEKMLAEARTPISIQIYAWDLLTKCISEQDLGHDRLISSLALSRGGKHYALVKDLSTEVEFYVAPKHKECLARFPGEIRAITFLTFSPVGLELLYSCDETAYLWDPLVHENEKLFDCSSFITVMAYSKEKKYIAIGMIDGGLVIWNCASKRVIGASTKGHKYSITSMTFYPEALWLLSGDSAGSICAWYIPTAIDDVDYIPLTFEGHNAAITGLDTLPDNDCFVSGSYDGTIRLWDIHFTDHHRDILPTQLKNSRIISVAFSLDGRYICFGTLCPVFYAWDLQERRLHEFTAKDIGYFGGGVCAIEPDLKGHRMVFGTTEGTLHSVTLPIKRYKTLHGHIGSVLATSFSPDAKLLLSGSADHTLRLWDLTNGTATLPALTGHDDNICCVSFSQDAQSFASGAANGSVILWKTNSGTSIESPKRHNGDVMSLKFDLDGKHVVSCAKDNTIHIWNSASNDVILKPLVGQHGVVNQAMILSQDGHFVASASYRTIRIHSAVTGVNIHVLRRDTGSLISGITFSFSAEYLASASEDGTICIWRTLSGQLVRNLQLPGSGMSDDPVITFSPQKLHIALDTDRNGIRLWDALNGSLIWDSIEGHSSSIRSIGISADERYIASTSLDNTIRVWDSFSGEPL